MIPSNISVYNESVLEITLVEPFSSDKNNLKFTWNTTDFTNKYI